MLDSEFDNDLLYSLGTEEVKNKVQKLAENKDSLNMLIIGKCNAITIEILESLNTNDIKLLSEQEKASFLKTVNDIKKANEKNTDVAIQINNNRFSMDELKRFEVDV